MGLRLVAHYLDRSEASIAFATLDAAGLAAFLENFEQVSVQPLSELALGGYRLMVCEEELDLALAVLKEAKGNPLHEGGELVTQHLTIAFVVLHLMQFLVWGGMLMWLPMRRHRWLERSRN
jgi:hypothetical protein